MTDRHKLPSRLLPLKSGAQLKMALFQMNQKSFTRTRRTNKSVYDFIEKYRRFIKISLFHNWNLTYEYKKVGIFKPKLARILDKPHSDSHLYQEPSTVL